MPSLKTFLTTGAIAAVFIAVAKKYVPGATNYL